MNNIAKVYNKIDWNDYIGGKLYNEYNLRLL